MMLPSAFVLVLLSTKLRISFAYEYSANKVITYRNARFDNSSCYVEEHKMWLLEGDSISLKQPCSKYKCLRLLTRYKVLSMGCGKIPSFFPPCRVRKEMKKRFPNCCPVLECPPYFKYLDAFLFMVTLLVASGDPEWSDPNAFRMLRWHEVTQTVMRFG